MKRRAFLTGLAAVGSAPLMPVKALGAASSAHQTGLYAKAAQWVGLWDHSSELMLKNYLKVDAETAKKLFGKLVRDRVIAAPNAAGMAQVVQPTYASGFVTAKVQEFALRQTNGFVGEPANLAQAPVQSAPKLRIEKPKIELDDLLEEDVAETGEEEVTDMNVMDEDPQD